jgi:hypothetical protein
MFALSANSADPLSTIARATLTGDARWMRIAGGLIWKQRLETGTGFAAAKLSEILPCGRVAPFVQDDKYAVASLPSFRMTKRKNRSKKIRQKRIT